MKYIHERIGSAKLRARRGLKKIRSVHAGRHVVRVAFPPGKRRRGSGMVQALLHPAKKITSNPVILDQSGRYRSIDGRFLPAGARKKFTRPRVYRNPVVLHKGGAYTEHQGRAPAKTRRKGFSRPRVYRVRENPPPVKIYDRVGSITAQKGPGHKCSAACRRANHWYVHDFTKKIAVWGMPDRSIVLR